MWITQFLHVLFSRIQAQVGGPNAWFKLLVFAFSQDLSVMIMSEKPVDEVELVEDPSEIHKIYKQSFIDEQVSS